MVNEEIKRVWKIASWYVENYQFPVVGVFSFNAAECRNEFSDSDGICCNQTFPTQGNKAIIGLDIAAINQGREYVAFLLMHETAHATGAGEHTAHYHALLDSLILAYNYAYGANVKNDYFSFNEER